MNSADDAPHGPSTDGIEPPNSKKLKLSTDDLDLPFQPTRCSGSSDTIIAPDNVNMKHIEEEQPSRNKVDDSNAAINGNEVIDLEQLIDETLASEQFLADVTDKTQEAHAIEEDIESQRRGQNPSLYPLADRQEVANSLSSTNDTVNQLPPSNLLAKFVGSDHEKFANAGLESNAMAFSVDDGSKSKENKSSGAAHVVKRRAPRKEPKPRLPLESRVFYSKKETDSATAFLADKEDLCDCLPLDDCFLLGEMFWIFTVTQLELALDESSANSPLNEMLAKFSNATIESNVKESTALESSSNSCSERADESSNVDLSPIGIFQSDGDTLMIENSNSGNTFTETCEASGLDRAPQLTDAAVTVADGKAVVQDSAIADTNTKRNIPNGEIMSNERITFWRESIIKFRKQATGRPIQPQEKFRLDGPIQLLFPQSTLNFFKSIRLDTVWKFLALRKSETGAVCDLMHIWRRECKMSVIPDIGLGRHFLAVAARVETALTVFPPIPESDRGYMLDPISGITGAAHDFLIRDHKIKSAAEFLDLKTKQLADVLEVWRQDNGMEKLRGSGKVAMISAWKACIKEALEVENDPGIVVDLSSYVALVLADKHAAPSGIVSDNGKHADIVNKSTGSRKATPDLTLHSKVTLERVLGEGASALLRSGGIRTAAELFAVDMNTESQLYNTLIETGIVDGMPAFTKAVQKWRESINQSLNKPHSGEDSTLSTHTSMNDSTRLKESTQKHNLAKKTNVGSTAKGIVRADIVKSSESNQPRIVTDDPAYDILSGTTKQFLSSMGIHNARDFLTTRSSELAINFVPWRRSMGKPELKGMGSIASISGWKSSVRKKAKEMGLNELAELEPTTRGAKGIHHQQTFHQEQTNDVQLFENGAADNVTDMDTTQHGEGLASENKELFSVQHQGIDYQSVFELSARPDKTSVQDRNLYITFKGITSRKSPPHIAERIHLNFILENGQSIEKERPVYILSDVPVCHKKGTIHGNDGSMLLFSSPSSVGLINISLHGAYPYQNQSLDYITMAIENFVANGHTATLDEFTCDSQEIYNVVVRQVRLDSFQYLLYLPIPLESGHTMKVMFPSVKTTFCLDSHIKSDFTIMHKINESFATLRVTDLQRLMTWLHDEANTLASIGEANLEQSVKVESLVRRRRLFWLERRIFAAMERLSKSTEDRSSNADCFVYKPNSYEPDSGISLTNEIEMELRYALEPDTKYGSKKKQGWSTAVQNFCDGVIKCVAQCLSLSGNDDCDWSTLLKLISSTVTPTIAAQTIQSVAITLSGSDDQMDVDGSTTSAEKNGHCQTQRESTSSAISSDFIWQFLNSLFDILRIDIFMTKKSDTLNSTLMSLRSILFDTDATLQKPIPVTYDEELYYSSSMPRSDVDYTPNSKMLFLGLVWPVLRNNGWRIAIEKDDNKVTYVPKAVSQKRWGAMKQRHDRQKVVTKRSLKVAGFHLIPKTVKRLLVAIANKSHGDDSNAGYHRTYTVEAVLERFLASLYVRFDSLKDFEKFKVNEFIRKIVFTIGECFDDCASMLVPIANLSPCWNIDGEPVRRPIAAYRCEYLIPFLFNFVSKESLQNSFNIKASPVGDAVHGLACDLLSYISEHYQEFVDQSLQPPLEEYIAIDAPTLWIETHIRSLLLEKELESHSTIISTSMNNGENVPPENELFQILLDEDMDQITDFIRITLENAKLLFATGSESRRKGRAGAPGLACRHCMGRNGEGQYFFSSMESLSACYPVLEKHYYKCPDTPPEVKKEVANARALHAQQRRLKQNGSQQAVFVKLWNRMMACTKPGIVPSPNNSAYLHDKTDERYEMDDHDAMDDEFVFHDHRAVLDFLRGHQDPNHSSNRRPDLSSAHEDVMEALATYDASLEYAGRVFGTPSMPPHFSTRWLIHKMTPRGPRSEDGWVGAG